MLRIADKVLGVEKFPFTLDEKHLQVIFCLKEEALSAKEISRRKGMPPSTVYRVISQLTYGGFIDKNLESLISSLKIIFGDEIGSEYFVAYCKEKVIFYNLYRG